MTTTTPYPPPRHVVFRPRPSAAVRLICVHFAGGSAGVFAPLGRATAQVEVVAIQLPGRAGASGEKWPQSLSRVIGNLADAMAPLVAGRPWAALGYSLGAMIAYELAWELVERGHGFPAHLFMCASPAPHHVESTPALASLDDAALVEEVSRRYGGIPPEVLGEPELLRLTLPTLRADLELHEAWQLPKRRPIPCGISAWAGRDDTTISPEALNGWADHGCDPFDTRRFVGGHFFHTQPEFFEAVDRRFDTARGGT